MLFCTMAVKGLSEHSTEAYFYFSMTGSVGVRLVNRHVNVDCEVIEISFTSMCTYKWIKIQFI